MNYLQDKGKDYIKNIYDKQSLSFHKENLRDLILSTLNGHSIICILGFFKKKEKVILYLYRFYKDDKICFKIT